MSDFLPKEKNIVWGDLRGDWVKEVDQPTMEINWDGKERYSEWKSTRKNDIVYRGTHKHREITTLKKERLVSREKAFTPGFAPWDAALNEAFSHTIPGTSFMGPGKAKTPQERGVPCYQGTPIENSMLIGAALRAMGAATVGFVKLENSTTRKLIYLQESNPAKTFTFEDCDVGYETDDRMVIPYNAKWVIVYSVRMSYDGLSQAPSLLARGTTMEAYCRLFSIYNQLHEFIRALGYHSYGAAAYNGFAPAVAFGVLAGLGELSRMDALITPEYGPMVRLASMATDLPLALTKPISFGVQEYCRICRVCADACPVKSISQERDPTWEVKGPWNAPGHKAYFRDAMKCRDYFYTSGSNCGLCFTKCPFSEADPDKYLNFVSHLQDEMEGKKNIHGTCRPQRDPGAWWKRPDPSERGL